MGPRFATLCTGIGCAELAAEGLGWESTFQSEIDLFACMLLTERFPLTPNIGDMTLLAARIRSGDMDDDLPDVLVAGTPCFPAGTMIATSTGIKPIESVTPGEYVLTHEGRFRMVTRTGAKMAPTWLLTGQGHPTMETTAEHPFLSMKREARGTRIKNKPVRLTWWSDQEWTHADKMKGRHWAFPEKWPSLPIPEIVIFGQEKVTVPVDAGLLRLAGAYVGDGWVRINDRRGVAILGLSKQKLEIIKPYVHAIGLNTTETAERTVIKLAVHGRAVARWLRDNFGNGAERKNIPMWLLGAPEELRNAFLQGYMDTDGSTKTEAPWVSMSATTVSKQLAFTLRSLVISLGSACSVQKVAVSPTAVIEGRTINQRPQWQVRSSTSNRSSVSKNDFRWQLVRESKPTSDIKEVFNLEVDSDNSYVADGIVVHNCQSFSIAGLGESLDDPRGRITLELVNVLNAIDERRWTRGETDRCILVWENVPNVLSKDDNPFGCLVGALVGADQPVVPFGKRGRWPRSGMVAGPGRSASWRILDAQYFGVAQRRRRLFLVAGAGADFDPASLLPESGCLRRDSPPRREAGQKPTGTIAARVKAGGGLGTDFDCDGGLIAISHTLSAARGAACANAADLETYIPVAYGGNNQSGPIPIATARSAHGGPHGRLDFETETFLVTGADVSHALNTANNGKHCSEDGTGRGVPIIAFNARQDTTSRAHVSDALSSSSPQSSAIAFDTTQLTSPLNYSNPQLGDPCHPLAAAAHVPAVVTNMQVRRLTVVECERLQGLPDNYTFIRDPRSRKRIEDDHFGYLSSHCPWMTRDEMERMAKDGPRYRAIGNGMAVPVVSWILRRIDNYLRGNR